LENYLAVETLVIELLLVATLVALAVRRLRVPYTVALVVVGLLITFGREMQVALSPELILALFVPPLVFEAAFHLRVRELRENLVAILVLAVPGVILTTVIVGLLVAWATPISLGAAFVFGALIAATDPVAVVALFRSIGAPQRLTVLVESESLFNDGTAIVVYTVALTAAVSGHFNPMAGTVELLTVAIGGIVVGLGLGAIVAWIIGRVDDYLIETTLTTVLAFGSYLVAERFHFSGVLAVVIAGIVCGNAGPKGMSPTTRIVLFKFWEYAAFLANSLVFLLIGLDVSIPALIASWQSVLMAVLAVLIARMVVVYGLGWIVGRLRHGIPMPFQHVLVWGGLRGAISLALALSLPLELGPDRELIRVMAFGVVLFTLLVQGTTLRFVIQRLGLIGQTEAERAFETVHARLAAAQAAARHLEQLRQAGSVTPRTLEALAPPLQERIASLIEDERGLLAANPSIQADVLDTARRELLRAERSTLLELRQDGVISDDVYYELAAHVDAQLERDHDSDVYMQNGGSADSVAGVQRDIDERHDRAD